MARGLPTPPSAPPPLSPLEIDDLLVEILLRVPCLPSALPRVAVVCKRWHRHVSDPSFFRRFCLHHRRSPPLLGFFVTDQVRRPLGFSPLLKVPNRIPSQRFFLEHGDGDQILDCRHSLVLILLGDGNRLLVWDPLTGDQHHITCPSHPRFGLAPIHGAVLRLAWDDDHFQVVLVGLDDGQADALCYSSKSMVWGHMISISLPQEDPTMSFNNSPAVLAGDSLYWLAFGRRSLPEVVDGAPISNSLVEFDVRRHRLSVARLVGDMNDMTDYQIWVIPEDEDICLLTLSGLTVHMWKRSTDSDSDTSWAITRTIDLNIRLPIDPDKHAGRVIIRGLAGYNRLLLLSSANRLFSLNIDTFQYDKFRERGWWYHPFESPYPSVPAACATEVIELDPAIHEAYPWKGPACIKPEECQTAEAALKVDSSCAYDDLRSNRLMEEDGDSIDYEVSLVPARNDVSAVAAFKDTTATAISDKHDANMENTHATVEAPGDSMSRHDHYLNYTPTEVVLTIFAKGVSADSLAVDFDEQMLSVSIELPGEEPYHFQSYLLSKIIPDKCKIILSSTKVEIRLAKADLEAWISFDYTETDIGVGDNAGDLRDSK